MKNVIFYLIAILFLTSCFKKHTTKTEVITLTKTSKSWNGDPLPKYGDGDPEVTILKITVPPKTKLAWHTHPEINAGVLLKGELTVISAAKDTLYLKAGDPIVEIVDTEHYGRNDGNESAEIIVFYAGIKGQPVTIIKEGEEHDH